MPSTSATLSLEDLARLAVDGDRDAVERLVQALQADVYGLTLRMLWHRESAEDATQEILVRVVTRLSQFDFRSRLRTWVFRVATNYLLDLKKSAVERLHLTFERFGDELADGLSDQGPADTERSTLIEEVKIGCTLGMLQCLDRPHRLAYILGEILELPSDEAAEAVGVEPAAFRKRLERARTRVEGFAREQCGLLSDRAACRCHRRVPAAIQLGRVRPGDLDFAGAGCSFAEARAAVRTIDEARRVLEIYRSNRPRASAVDFARRVVSAL
jgi:RNA polymerase sigma factor (sigma-70 family)